MPVSTDRSTAAIRVVAFTGGPTLRSGILRFLGLLEDHPAIELAAVYCQSPGESTAEIVRDLWRRRGLLALPVLVRNATESIYELIIHPGERAGRTALRRRLSGRIHFVRNIHEPQVIEAVRAARADVGAVYGAPILRPELFTIPRFGTLGIHHGTLPEYRGKKTTFWELYNGEETAGVTIQRINEGLDTGEIIRSGHVEVGNRSLREVWKDLERLGMEIYVEAILDLPDLLSASRQAVGPGKLYRDPALLDLVIFYGRGFVRRLHGISRPERAGKKSADESP